MMEDRSYLGTGWAFPVRFDKHHGVGLSSEEKDIRESLEILFSTVPGERVFRTHYGCDLRKWVFSKMDLTEKTLIIDVIKQAILTGEPRIMIESIDLEIKDELKGIMMIYLECTVQSTNSRSSMVYPFYFLEGTRL